MPTILRYGIAILSVAIANGLAFLVLRYFEAILTPFLFAVAVTVWYAGTGPGVLAIALSVISLNYFFLRPSFSFSPISSADLVYLTFCIFCALGVGWVSAVRRHAEQELRQARDELEVKVVERTADLRRSERYLTETQKLTHTGSWAWDARSQKVLYCSEEMFRIYGLDPQEDLPTRKNFRQRVHPEDRNRVDERFARVVNEKVDSFDEYRVLLPDGTVKHVISSGHPVLDGNGELIAFIGTATDVTERRRAEEALRDREAKIRRLVDSNIIGIFITGLEGRVLEANDAFLHLVGQERDDLVSGRIRWTDLTPPEWRERDKRALAELNSNTIARPYEKEFFRKDGSRVPVLIGGALFEEGGNEGVAFVLDLTERKCAEEALRESEAKIRRLVDSNIIGIFVWDFDGRILEANDEFLRMVSYNREELFSGCIRWADLTPPDWRDRNNARIEQQKSSGRFEPFEKEFTRKDGSRVPILIGGATFEEGGNQGVAFVLDLTERKRAEQALVRSEAYLAETQKLTHTGTWAWDARSQKVLFCSEEMFRIYGLDPEVDLPTRRNFRQRVHPEDRNRVDERQARVVNEKVGSFDEFRIVLPDGTVKHVSSTWHTFLDGNGELIELIGTATDITERKYAEEALRASERSARSALDGIAGLVAIMTPNGEVETVNRQCVEYFGRPVEEQKDWVTTDMVHPEDLPDMLENFKRAIVSEIPYHFEQRLRRFDGEYRWFETRGGAVRDDTGSIVRWYVLLTDIEDRIRALARLAQAQLELAHANRVATMGQLTASITHEVNQPITAAVTYALAARRFLSAAPPNFHEVDDALSRIVKEGNRAGEVVGRIRALIKKAPARKDAVEINDAILEIVALTRTEAADNNVSVRTQLAEGLPHVQGDRVQLQQVLINLIINAIEAMRDVGEEEREVLISTRREPDGVSVEVQDSGPGFAPADLDRVFEAFYTTKSDGLGLGLSICRSIIEAHDGRLWASPNVPRGAIFGFIAPAHPAARIVSGAPLH
ncbi:PAS domain S-box protein [Bradyrhizobium sp. AZCC 2262]|uniref:PAS domain S-box protein n=1 Tax=Bradyrhizobium sp. AZCC 2262 TaxID=3117022 RepID=UPI002FF008F5